MPPVGDGRLWLGLLLAPLAWLAYEGAGYVLAARGCAAARVDDTSTVLGMQAFVALACGAVGVAGLAVAIANWRRASAASAASAAGAAGGAWERARFMSFTGIVASAIFLLGIALFALPVALVDACNPIR